MGKARGSSLKSNQTPEGGKNHFLRGQGNGLCGLLEDYGDTPPPPRFTFPLSFPTVDTALCLEKTRFLEEQQKEQKNLNFSLKHKQTTEVFKL